MKWQRVEQVVEPVVCHVVDVGVLTQVLTQHRRLWGVVNVELGWTVQRHQNDQTLLSLHHDVVMKCNFELVHTISAVNTRSRSVNDRSRQTDIVKQK